MTKFFSYFESFAFKYVNIWDRATRAEYWCVMPVIWGLIVLAFVWDVQEVWGFLLAREVPPMSPLYYESMVLFTLTIIPRWSLTVRRLHDSGRAGKWAMLPMMSLMSMLFLMIGLGSVLMSSSMASLTDLQGASISVIFIIAALAAGQVETFWQGMFAVAALLNAIGWDAIWAVLAEIGSNTQKPEVGAAVVNLGRSVKESPVEGVQLMIVMVGTIATPFIAAFMHILFMLLPSDRDHNLYGDSAMAPITGAPKGKTSHNPMAGYACLFEKTPEELAQLKQSQEAELKALYRERVLGQQGKPVHSVSGQT